MSKRGAYLAGNAIIPAKGEVWIATKGVSATFVCGNVLELHRSGRLSDLCPRGIDWVYTDPPWNVGIRRAFHRYANEAPPTEPFPDFLDSALLAIRSVCIADAVIGVEMGGGGVEALLEAFGRCGFRVIGSGVSVYGSPPRPCHIHYVTAGDAKPVLVPEGMDGKKALADAADKAAGARLLFEPFAGELVFAEAFMRAGVSVFGVELIPAKLGKGLTRLKRRGWEVKRA